MTAPHIVDPAGLLGEALAEASPDLMRSLLQYDHQRPAVRGRRRGRRRRVGPTQPRTGRPSATVTATATSTPGSARSTSRSRSCVKGTYFPEWLLERRKRAESALITVVADCYLAGVSTRRMDKLVKTLGHRLAVEVAGLPDGGRPRRHRRGVPPPPPRRRRAVHVRRRRRAHDEGPRRRPRGQRRRAASRPASTATATAKSSACASPPAKTGAAWNEFFADLVARGLAGVRLVTSDAHAGLNDAIAANLPGAAWQRCRTHYAANLMSVTPKSMWPAVKAMLHSVYDQPDAASRARPVRPAPGLRRRQAPRRRRPPRRAPAPTSSRSPLPQGRLDPDLVQQPRPSA